MASDAAMASGAALGVTHPKQGPERQPKHIHARHADSQATSNKTLMCVHKLKSAERPDHQLDFGLIQAAPEESADAQLDFSLNCSKKALVCKPKAESEVNADKQLDVGLECSDNSFVQKLLCCPITKEPMDSPTIAADGHTYEKAAIEAWVRCNNTSPVTGCVMAHSRLLPNVAIRSLISDTHII